VRPTDDQIDRLREMVATDEGARLVLAVFQDSPQAEINVLVGEFVASQEEAVGRDG
jgi:hypothetical protein